VDLIDKFENMPFQDVGTFNSIFKNCPILGVSFDTSVEIKELVKGERRVIVGSSEILIDLTKKAILKNEPKVKKELTKIKKSNPRRKLVLSEIYTLLKPTEFLIYCAIKESGEIDGVEELSRAIKISSKTIHANLKRLLELKLVKVEYVACRSGSFNKLTIDTTTKM
jgi:DNA-binding transcriptional ArsR family regulator